MPWTLRMQLSGSDQGAGEACTPTRKKLKSRRVRSSRCRSTASNTSNEKLLLENGCLVLDRTGTREDRGLCRLWQVSNTRPQTPSLAC